MASHTRPRSSSVTNDQSWAEKSPWNAWAPAVSMYVRMRTATELRVQTAEAPWAMPSSRSQSPSMRVDFRPAVRGTTTTASSSAPSVIAIAELKTNSAAGRPQRPSGPESASTVGAAAPVRTRPIEPTIAPTRR